MDNEKMAGTVDPQAKKSRGLFDKLYEDAKAIIKDMSQPLVKRALRRKYESALDDQLKSIDEKTVQLMNLKEDLVNYDLGKIINLKADIASHKAAVAAIQEDYVEMFGEYLEIPK